MTAASETSAKALYDPDEVCGVPCFNRDKVAAVRRSLTSDDAQLPDLAEFYKLLGNPTRLKVLLALTQGEMCVCDMAHVLGLSVAATSHQLKMLRERGWLRVRNDGKMIYYRLEHEALLGALRTHAEVLESRLA